MDLEDLKTLLIHNIEKKKITFECIKYEYLKLKIRNHIEGLTTKNENRLINYHDEFNDLIKHIERGEKLLEELNEYLK